MTELQTLRLRLDEGRLLPIQIRKQTTERSAHTGRDLVELHAWTETSDVEHHRELASLLQGLGEQPVRAQDEEGEFAGDWCVSWNSYAESGGVHTYNLILREAEELSLEVLLVDELELYPYEYREEVVGEGLTIQAKVLGSEEDVLRLRRLVRSRDTVQVVRRGISQEPREMRLAVAEWSVFEAQIKYRLVLVDRKLDGSGRSELARIEEEGNRAALGFYANLVERLSELLVERGVLSRDELSAVRDAARREPGVARHELWRVPDIDAL